MADTQVKAAEAVAPVQARGVWHRPNVTGVEVNLAGVCSVLDTLRETGINLVFLETFYHGMTVYRSSFVPYYTGFDAYDYSPYPDYLSAFVAEAEKRGIEVHAWVEDFYIGVDENYFTRHLPQWMMLTKDGSIRQSEGEDYGGYLFLDPANPEVRQYLIQFYHELLTRFPTLGGLNLDYIRYPLSDRQDDTGYTEVAMNGFAAEAEISFPEDATRQDKVDLVTAQYSAWIQYRADQVTTFVGQVYEMVKSQHPGMLLSTAVFPEQGKSFADKKQDFNTWLKRGYLDIITPMAYYDDIATLKRALEGMLPGLSECYCYAGISPTYHNLSDQSVIQQMQTTQQVGADGYVFFGSQSILGNRQYIELLKKTTPDAALLPHADAGKLIKQTIDVLEQSLAAAGEPTENVKLLCSQLEEMAAAAEDQDPGKMQQVCKQLRLLTKYNLHTCVSEENRDMAQQTLSQLLRWIDVKTTRLFNKYPQQPDNPQIPGEPEPPEESVPSTEPTSSAEPTEPEQTVPSAVPPAQMLQETPDNHEAKFKKVLGIGAVAAALAAAVTACLHVIRKGRKKNET